MLRQPPLASWKGKAAEGIQRTITLLAAIETGLVTQHSADSAEQLFRGLQKHQTTKLITQLLVWLQQRPEVVVTQVAGGAGSGSSSYATTLWTACMEGLMSVAAFLGTHVDLNGQSNEAVAYVEQWALVVDSSGAGARSAAADLRQQ